MDNDRKRINVNVGLKTYIEFKKKLIECGVSGTDWLREQVKEYCLMKEGISLKNKTAFENGYDFSEDYKVFNAFLSGPIYLKFRKKLVEENLNVSSWVRLHIYRFIDG